MFINSIMEIIISTTSLIRVGQLSSAPGRPGKLPFSQATILRWEKLGLFPKSFKVGGARVWRLEDVEAFLAAKAVL